MATVPARRVCALLLALAVVPAVLAAAPSPSGASSSGHAPGAVVHTLQSIEILGNHVLGSEQLAQAGGLKIGAAATVESIGAALDRIVATYQAKGKTLTISAVLSFPDASHASVAIVIDEAGADGNRGVTARGDRLRLPPVPPPATRQ